jgi:NAD(P)-dependent dehydrogenase (short-subunit alcohol dehydrogenase family)
MKNIKSALITGANKSIGFETVRQLLQNGYYVYLGSRDLQKGLEAVKQLNAEGLKEVEAVEIDVSNQESVQAARVTIGKKAEVLDVLINNAGISGGLPQSALDASIDQFRTVYETNIFGVIRVTQAFIDLLKKAAAPRIVNVTSRQGSLTLASDSSLPSYKVKAAVYHSSKSALNMYTINLAYELRDSAFRVNMVDPGFTNTDFNHHRGTGTVEDAAKRIAKYALIGEEGPTGKFICEEMFPFTLVCPW